MKTKLPNFLIVGAAKSGTSSLHNYLNQHIDIFMPSYTEQGVKVKEPRFLIKDLIQNRVHNGIWNWSDYKELFNNVKDEKLIGESTVLYLYYYKEAIKNIKLRLGDDIKIIIMLRNPVERAYSAYQHVSRGMKENNTFEKALELEEERLDKDPFLTPMVMYKSMGMYFKMVKAYLESFDQVHIIYYEDFRDNTMDSVQKTFDFLGVDRDPSINIKMYNVGGRRWNNYLLKRFFMKQGRFHFLLKLLIPNRFRTFFRNQLVNYSMENSPTISLKVKKELRSFFKKDIEHLSKLLNKDLKHWIE